ncbi:SDR family oxidoreductase [Streptomyces phyllanthi]|uniref:SDR family NAD(P)-dependent oxidoreductase n=1 Tax=Streptomyces phyllanthi TaxID=1803180 RepID=A0A5N8VVC0_9ACTN|nr:SDR family NAD(P)-dependent oxidoreductase [Streptomyces phyllanthi]MPY39221.1 SDR family NAD(P)-dependent oxidoreductase [Streptomyces phyllanthi]
MPVIAIVGAGPGMGLAIARRFGSEGFDVALLARSRDKLDDLVAQLADEGIQAAGFTADVTRPDTLREALAAAESRFGPIDVLEYSPANHALGGVSVLETAREDLQPQFEHYVYGALTAVSQVLPGMLRRGSGTLLLSTGASSVRPLGGTFGSIGIAAAALRNYALALNVDLAEHGVHATHVAIGVMIGSGPGTEAATIAEHYWQAHTKRDQAEIVHAMPGGPW